MEEKIKAYIKNLVMVHKSQKAQSIIEEQKGNAELMMFHLHKASALEVVINDLKRIVKGEPNE